MSLWAITSYFNPERYRRRLDNYRRFWGQLSLPLVTVELSFGGSFELGKGDADLLVSLRGEAVLWQKERLLNVALQHLPPSCTRVVALDCDVVFQRPDWPKLLERALEEAVLVQPFSQALHLPEDNLAEAPILRAPSLAHASTEGKSSDALMGRMTDRTDGVPTPGFAWAADRGLFERHGFYDKCILGGGDTALACAAYGKYDIAAELHGMNTRQRACYYAWAKPFYEDVSGRVSCLRGDLHHLWHGSLANRQAQERHRGLAPFDFDPETDLEPSSSGCWRWSSAKPELHRYAREYFRCRQEDG